MLRTHTAGSLRVEHIATTVTLTGWVDRRRDHGGVAFVDLRDASGIAQVVIHDEAVAHALRSEFVLQVTGEVSRRPEGNENPHLPTGEIEVIAKDVVTLNEAAPLPFQVSSTVDETPGEEVRLRAKVSQAARRVLDDHGFVEIETPTLTHSTPEGARDFLVPARLSPGSKLALTANKTPVWLLCTQDAPAEAREALQTKGVEVIAIASDEQGRADIRAVAAELGKRQLNRVLVEGGGEIAAAFLKAGLVDRISSYQAGLLMGADSRSAVAPLGLEKLDFAPRFALVSSRIVGGDVLETWHRAA